VRAGDLRPCRRAVLLGVRKLWQASAFAFLTSAGLFRLAEIP
jgi:hypothetical protein